MEEKRCKNCKWWGAPWTLPTEWDVRYCEYREHDEAPDLPLKNGWNMTTGPEYGCVHWEKRETE